MDPASARRAFEIHCLSDGPAQLVLAPQAGGGIVELSVAGRHVLRPYLKTGAPSPFELGSIVLVPFSNRIAQGVFDWDGRQQSLPANVAGEPYPIHGDGFQKAWIAEAAGAAQVQLQLEEGGAGPFRYSAQQEIALHADHLDLGLTVTNTGEAALPFGLGFHPWFPRTSHTRLQFSAAGIWLNDENTSSRELIGIAEKPEWNFRHARSLPDGLIDNAFAEWDGRASILQGPEHMSVRLRASPILSTALVYSPGRSADFFCLEPVSHPINAHNLPSRPGLVTLLPGEAMTASIAIEWDAP